MNTPAAIIIGAAIIAGSILASRVWERSRFQIAHAYPSAAWVIDTTTGRVELVMVDKSVTVIRP